MVAVVDTAGDVSRQGPRRLTEQLQMGGDQLHGLGFQADGHLVAEAEGRGCAS